MSSHHIVREKQEPALLVLGMDTFADDLLGQLLEWSPTVMATAQAAEKLVSLGIKVDVVMGDDEVAGSQSNVKHIRESGSKTETALRYLVANGYPAVNVVADSFDLDEYLPFADAINIVICCGNKKIYPVSSGFEKWLPAGESIEFLNAGEDVSVTGLQKASYNNYLTQTDGFFSLQFTQPHLFIAENIL